MNLTFQQIVFVIYSALIVLMSLFSFVAFLSDKKKAQRGGERTKEKTLLCLTVLNGAIGSLIGRLVAHHKTDKIYFSITIYFSLLCQIAVFAVLLFFAFFYKAM
ncbi:MAG: DUF1294 domain-containing protein [Bacilli bacterium]|nr:DUF1294 domain-containing protein [Bacilli bacterium]